jgi:hypothetical protein
LKHNIGYKKSDISVEMANNSKINILGKTDPIEVKIADYSVAVEMIVMEHEGHELLVGMDWLDEANVWINTAQNTISRVNPKTNEFITLKGNEYESEEDEDENKFLLTQDVNLYKSEPIDEDFLENETWQDNSSKNSISLGVKLDKIQREQFVSSGCKTAILERSAFEMGDLEKTDLKPHKIILDHNEPIFTAPTVNR